MAENTNLNETLEAWADITLDKWRQKMQQMHIGATGELARSLRQHVTMSANGESFRIEFFYNWYGKMVDLGVGKGTKLGDIAENKLARRLMGRGATNPRRAKVWKSKTFYAETAKLNAILLEKYNRKAVQSILESIDKVVTIKL